MFVDGLKRLLMTRPEFVIVGEAYNGERAIELLHSNKVDILILDINMPELDGIAVTRMVAKEFPQVKILILSMHTETDFAKELLRLGASGYLMKNTGKEELFLAINSILTEGKYISTELVTKSEPQPESIKTKEEFDKKYNLTRREIEVLKLLVQGKTSPEIASALFLATYTVDTHRKNLLRKLSLKNTAGLVRFAIAHNLIT
jgi:DNA-binding NarL/FixJ family response regulator